MIQFSCVAACGFAEKIRNEVEREEKEVETKKSSAAAPLASPSHQSSQAAEQGS
jgi:hypothetical protein